MFGYVNIYKSELKIKDYEVFRAYYCGLCKALGKRYNQLVRLGLSYDMTFLAILYDALKEDRPDVINDGCVKHIGKHMICAHNSAIDFCSDISIILTYYKLCDDISDDKSIKAILARIPYYRAVKKASLKYPNVANEIKKNLEILLNLEKNKCESIDMVADPFAKLTEEIFYAASPSLSKLGYNIGRFIYIADAVKDIEDDIKENSYNPFVCLCGKDGVHSEEFKKRVMGTMNMTLSAVSNEYSGLSIKKNKAILDNIIYMGLRNVCDNLFNTEEKQ